MREKISSKTIHIRLKVSAMLKRNHNSIYNSFSLYANGNDGTFWFGALGRKINKGLTMKEFGDNIGICLHYQTADDIAGELADVELEKFPKKKRAELIP